MIYDAYKQYTLDKSLNIPLYFQVKKIFLDMIQNEQLLPGDILPTELELCEILNVSRTTIRQAISALVTEGILYRVKGYGTYVSYSKHVHPLSNSQIPICGEIFRHDALLPMKLIHFRNEEASIELSRILSVPLLSDVISIKRLSFVDDLPTLLSHAYLPNPLCKSILSHNMSAHSIPEVLKDSIQTRIVRASHKVESSIATKEDCDTFYISKSTGICIIKSICYNKYDTPVVYCVSRYRGDLNALNVEQQIIFS